MLKLLTLVALVVLDVLAAAPVPAQERPTGQGSEITFKISVPLEFKAHVVSGSLRKSEIPELLDLPVRNGNTDLKEGYGVEMTRPNYEKFMVYTCWQWKKALKEEAYAASTYDMSMEGSLIHACGLLFELQRAKQPIKSFVSNPKVTLADFNLLPAAILAFMPDDENERERLRSKTVSQTVPKQDIERADGKAISLSYGGFRQNFWEAARADFDGDGVEDILVFTGGRAEGGTMGYADYFIVTRTSPSGPLKVIENRKSP